MKIRITCSTSKAGACGVGDYVRRLSHALVGLGHEVEILAINDKYIINAVVEKEWTRINESYFLVRRFPASDSTAWFAFRATMSPDWFISYQFPSFYHYSNRGIPLGFNAKIFGAASIQRLHIMIHETWLDSNSFTFSTRSVLGLWQRYVLASWISNNRPALITTTVKSYQNSLSSLGFNSKLLPLFSNISSSTDSSGWFKSEMLKININTDFVVGVFGTVWSEFSPDQFLSGLIDVLEKYSRNALLVFIGKSGSFAEIISKRISIKFGGRLPVIILGKKSESEIIDFMNNINIGLSTIQWGLSGKSSAVATMLDRGVPVIVTRDSVIDGDVEIDDPLLFRWRPGNTINIDCFRRRNPRESVIATAQTFASLLAGDQPTF